MLNILWVIMIAGGIFFAAFSWHNGADNRKFYFIFNRGGEFMYFYAGVTVSGTA